MRIICPTCKYLDSPESKGDCILHRNSNKQKYFCFCDGGVTKQEMRRYIKMKQRES